MKISKVMTELMTAGIAVALVCISSCSSKKTQEAEASFAVNTYMITKEKLDDYLEFGGDVVASSVVNVMPDTGGKISKIKVAVGDFVKKDQILAYIDPSRPGMTYSENPVKAPVSGTVTSFPLSIGATAGPASPVGQISSTEKLEIQMNVAERFISRIKNGQSATVTFDAYPGDRFSARVFEISPVLDTSTRTLKVKLRLDPPDDKIKSGMYARIKLVTEELSNAIVIPYDALVSRDDKMYAFTVARTETDEKNTTDEQNGIPAVAHLTEVKQGIHVDDKIEITEGLSAGQEIVVRGQTLLNDGSKINIMNAEKASD